MRMRLSSNPYVWHQWFAVRPVMVEGQLVWWEVVERKLIKSWDRLTERWDYRTAGSRESVRLEVAKDLHQLLMGTVSAAGGRVLIENSHTGDLDVTKLVLTELPNGTELRLMPR